MRFFHWSYRELMELPTDWLPVVYEVIQESNQAAGG